MILKNMGSKTLIAYDLLPFLNKRKKSSLCVKAFAVSAKIRG